MQITINLPDDKIYNDQELKELVSKKLEESKMYNDEYFNHVFRKTMTRIVLNTMYNSGKSYYTYTDEEDVGSVEPTHKFEKLLKDIMEAEIAKILSSFLRDYIESDPKMKDVIHDTIEKVLPGVITFGIMDIVKESMNRTMSDYNAYQHRQMIETIQYEFSRRMQH